MHEEYYHHKRASMHEGDLSLIKHFQGSPCPRDRLLCDLSALYLDRGGTFCDKGVAQLEHALQCELADREDFVIYASELMRNRLVGTDISEAMGWDAKAVEEHTLNSESGRAFRAMLFMRVVPNLKKLGVRTPRVRRAFTELEIIHFEDVDTDALDRQMDFL